MTSDEEPAEVEAEEASDDQPTPDAITLDQAREYLDRLPGRALNRELIEQYVENMADGPFLDIRRPRTQTEIRQYLGRTDGETPSGQ